MDNWRASRREDQRELRAEWVGETIFWKASATAPPLVAAMLPMPSEETPPAPPAAPIPLPQTPTPMSSILEAPHNHRSAGAHSMAPLGAPAPRQQPNQNRSRHRRCPRRNHHRFPTVYVYSNRHSVIQIDLMDMAHSHHRDDALKSSLGHTLPVTLSLTRSSPSPTEFRTKGSSSSLRMNLVDKPSQQMRRLKTTSRTPSTRPF